MMTVTVTLPLTAEVITFLQSLITSVPAPAPTPSPAPAPLPEPIPRSKFIVDGISRDFIFGANVRSLINYGMPGSWMTQYSSLDDVKATMRGLKDMGVKVIRVYAAHNQNTAPAAIDRLRIIAGLARTYGLKLLVILNDNVSGSPFWPKDDTKYRTGDEVTMSWYHEGWKETYLPFVVAIVKTFKTDPAIFGWSIGNEYATPGHQVNSLQDATAILQFMLDAFDQIQRLADPSQVITTGLETTYQVFTINAPTLAQKLFEKFQNCEVHFYRTLGKQEAFYGPGDDHVRTDLALANKLEIPTMVGEFGIARDPGQDSSALVASMLPQMYKDGVDMLLQWGVEIPAAQWSVGWYDRTGLTSASVINNMPVKTDFAAVVNAYAPWAFRA